MVDSVFNVTGVPDCSVFAPQAGYGADTFVSFVRSTLRVNTTLAQPRLNSSGETGLSYASSGSFLLSLQPKSGGYVRVIQGIITQVDVMGFVVGNADIRPGDRCTLSSARLECITAMHYGTESTEIELKYLGR